MSCFQPLNSLGHIDGVLEGNEESFKFYPRQSFKITGMTINEQ